MHPLLQSILSSLSIPFHLEGLLQGLAGRWDQFHQGRWDLSGLLQGPSDLEDLLFLSSPSILWHRLVL